MTSPRAVRIPRSKGSPAPGDAAPSPPATGTAPPEPPAKVEVRWNQAANERARRLLLLYLGTLVVLYVAFLVLDRSAPGGTSATALTGMLYFSAIAAVLAVVGVWVALAPVPRRIEVSSGGVVVVESWGTKRAFPPVDELRATLVRRYPRSFLSSRAVETVEVTDRSGRRRTYQLEQGVVPVPGSDAR